MSNGPIEEGGYYRCNGCTYSRDKGQFFCAEPSVQKKVLGSDAISVVRLIGSTDRTPPFCPFLMAARPGGTHAATDC